MTLGGKSLLASALLNSAVVVVMAAVAFHPAPKPSIPSEGDELGAGTTLILDAPADAAPPMESVEPVAPLEIAPPAPPNPAVEIESSPIANPPTVAEIVSTTSPSVLPAIAASPLVSSERKENKSRTKASARRENAMGIGPESGRSGTAGIANYTPATYAQTPHPIYPAAAKKAGISGTVILSVSVDESGRPVSVTKARGCGCAELDDAAMAAVRKWRFNPAKMNGQPVAARLQVPVRFALK
ncbi:MAG: hypothetical protein RL088_2268 [Verrucomicrobiota bacterium]|jgi:protein TonB